MKRWLSSFSNRSRMYLYGPVLIILELVLRNGLQNGLHLTNTQAFIGPSMAAVGASALLPLTFEKPLTSERLEKMPPEVKDKLIAAQQHPEVSVSLTKEKNFIGTCWAVAIICTCVWFISLFLSLTQPDSSFLALPVNYWPGIIVYAISVILSEVREELI